MSASISTRRLHRTATTTSRVGLVTGAVIQPRPRRTMMSENRPAPRLYKYQPFNAKTLTNLTRASIWFSAPINVNDPYDCASWVVQADEVSEADFPRLLAYVRGRDPALTAKLTPAELREAFIASARRA